MSVTRCHPLAETVLPVPALCLEAPCKGSIGPLPSSLSWRLPLRKLC
jgi:hypothetical protein